MSKNADIKENNKIVTGITGFELISMGGLPEGKVTLISGSSGSCKTFFMVETAYRNASQFNNPCVFFSFEERVDDIIRNFSSLGWDISRLVKEKKLKFIDATPEGIHMEESGEYDFSGLIEIVKNAAKEIGAKIVFFDSISGLFCQYRNRDIIRRELLRLVNILKDLNITLVFSTERLNEYGSVSRYGFEEYISDNVIILRNVLKNEKCRRTIQILKMRGSDHFKGEYPVAISDEGLGIIPLSAMKVTQSLSHERISTGNDKLDKITDGGVFSDSAILISGPTGAGKTLIADMFAYQGLLDGKNVLYLGYEESKEQLVRNAKSWNMDFSEMEKKGLLKIICRYPEAMSQEDHLLNTWKEIDEFKPSRIVLDSVSAMERASGDHTFREFVIGFITYAKRKGIATIMTTTSSQMSGGDTITDIHVSTLTDTIVLLRYFERNAHVYRCLTVLKMRGSQHEKNIYEFNINEKGLQVEEPLKNLKESILNISFGN